MNFSLAECVQLFVHGCRIFDSESCLYTGNAKGDVYGTLGRLQKLGPPQLSRTAVVARCHRARLEVLHAMESRCQLLSQTLPPLEKRIPNLFADSSMD